MQVRVGGGGVKRCGREMKEQSVSGRVVTGSKHIHIHTHTHTCTHTSKDKSKNKPTLSI